MNNFSKYVAPISPHFVNLTHNATQVLSYLPNITDYQQLTITIRQYLDYEQVALYLTVPNQKSVILQTPFVANSQRSAQAQPSASLPHIAMRERSIVKIDELAKDLEQYYQVETTDIQSELYLPLMVNSKIVGILGLSSTQSYKFADEATVAILKMLANQIALWLDTYMTLQNNIVAPQPAKLDINFNNADEITYEVKLEIVTDELRELFNYIVNSVVEKLGYLGSMVAVVDERSKILSLQAMAFDSFIYRLGLVEQAEKRLGFKAIGAYQSLTDLQHQDSLGVQSCLTGQIRVSHSLYDLFRPVVNNTICFLLQKTSGVRTCISIPLVVNGRVVGNLYAGTKDAEFTKDDQEKLELFATNAAIALKNALHLNQMQKVFLQKHEKLQQLQKDFSNRMVELKTLHEIERMIVSLDIENVDNVLKNILEGALKLAQAEYGQVTLIGKYGSRLVRDIHYPEKTNDFLTEQPSRLLQRIKITLNNDIIGYIVIGNLEMKSFDTYTISRLEQLAGLAAIAIQNAYNVKLDKEKEIKLRNTEMLTAMGGVASNMVHRINNSVGSIRADIIELKGVAFDDEFIGQDKTTYLEILDDMLANAEKTLIFAKKMRDPFQPVKTEALDISECIDTVLVENNFLNRSDLTIARILPVNLPEVQATQHVQLVFENLINNALRVMNNKGKISISSDYKIGDDWVNVYVQDSGPGISSHIENVADIFKLGISDSKTGMGFGLWWCRTHLKNLGGDIELVENTPHGCMFLVKLPVKKGGFESIGVK